MSEQCFCFRKTGESVARHRRTKTMGSLFGIIANDYV